MSTTYAFTVTGHFSQYDFEVEHPEGWDSMAFDQQSKWEEETFADAASEVFCDEAQYAEMSRDF